MSASPARRMQSFYAMHADRRRTKRPQDWRAALLSDSHGLASVAIRDGRVHDANAAARRFFGEPCVGMAVDELYSGASAEKLRDMLSKAVPATAELEASRAGERIQARFLVLPAQDETLLVALTTAVGDAEKEVASISELMRTDRELATLSGFGIGQEPPQVLPSDLEAQHLGEFAALSDAAIAVSDAVADLPQSGVVAVLHTIALQAQNLTHAEYVALGIGTDPSRSFNPWISLGVAPEVMTAIGRTPRPVGLLGVVAREGKVRRERDVRRDEGFRGYPMHHPEMGPFLGIPIHYRGRPVGNLYLANKPGAREFSTKDERLMCMLAARVGVAIETALLYTGERMQRVWLQNIIEQMPDGVLLYDEHGHLKTMNQASAALCCEPTGHTDPLGNPVLFDIRGPDGHIIPDDELPLIRVFRGHDVIVRKEALIRRRNGHFVPVSISAVPVREIDGRLSGVTMLLEDISVRKGLERLREEWAAVVAHDLRQPVGVVSLATEMLDRCHTGEWPERDRRAIDRIRSASAQLNRMISDLTHVALIESERLPVDMKPFEMRELVDAAMESLSEQAPGHDLNVSVEGDPVAWVDRDRIQQILGNLISNAAKYGEPDTPIRIEVHASDDFVEVVVTNQGAGISPAQMPLLFSRFGRTKEARTATTPGLGLGLYIAKGLVEAHGGRIWVESVPGKTTSFHFTLRRGSLPRPEIASPSVGLPAR